MQKIILFFLAMIACNFTYSQGLDDMILDQDGGEILRNLPAQDRLKLERYFLKKCPECPQIKKPVKKSSSMSAPKQAPTPTTPIFNTIIGENNYQKIEINYDRNGFRLNLEKAKPAVCCPEKIIWVPIVKGDSVILFPGADPVPLPHVLPNPNGNYFNSVPDLGNPSGGSSKNFPGMSEKFGYPLFLAFLLGLLMLWGTYLLSRLRSTGTSSVTSITSETSAPPAASAKNETPVSSEDKQKGGESERKAGGGEEEAG